MFAVINDGEALFSDVSHVQKELEKFDAKSAVDANEIYELLETNSFRSDRVRFVTTHLLVTLGLQNNFVDEDVISISDESVENYLDDPLCVSSAQCNVSALDLSVPDLHSATGSSASIGYAEALTASKVDDPSSSISQNQTKNGSEVHEMAADASKTESNVVVLNSSVETHNTKHNSEYNNSHAVSPPTYRNDDLICDVNNNDPNNNTEYEVPVQAEDKQEQYYSPARETDDSGMEFEDQDDVCRKLLEEARLIHRIVPRQNLEQIYSYLEANLDRKNRVQIVMQEFLTMELAPELCHSAISNNGSVGNKSEVPCHHSISVPETQVLSETQPRTSSVRKIKTVKKDAVKTNIHSEPQPSTSGTSTMERKALKSNAVSEPCPFASKRAKVNTKGSAFKKKNGVKVEQGKFSESHPPDGKSCREEDTAGQVCADIMHAADSEIRTVAFATNTKRPYIWEVSSTSTSSASAEQNSSITDNEGKVGITSTSSLNKQTYADSDSDGGCVVEIQFSDSVRLGLDGDDDGCVAKPGTSEACVHATVETLIPSSSTENVEVITTTSTGENNKRKSESVESSSGKKTKTGHYSQSHTLLQSEVAADEVMLTQDQLKYKSLLMEMFPDADPQHVRQQCQTLETEESVHDVVTQLLESDNYPRRQTPKEVPVEPLAGPSTSAMPDKKRVEMEYETLVAILPNADPAYLQETFEKIGNDENAMKTFVSNALETKEYPTLEDYRKRQEALALQKKYTEQFSIEGFLEILPDPFKYFMEEKKNDKTCTQHAMAYLKGRYRRIRHEDLKSSFCHHHYNLTLTCQELDRFRGELLRNRRSEYDCSIPTEVDIPFLQEVAFIENKEKIGDYLKEKADRKKRAFEEAKAKGDLLECGCCFDNEVMLEDMAACNEGHLFCKDCVRKGAEVQIGNGKTTFPCLSDCGAELSLKTLQGVLKPSVLSKMLQRKQLEEVKAAGIEDLETCPFCDFASIPPREDKVFRCLNPDCMRESCRKCKEPNHVPLRCDEVEKADEVRIRTYIEDRMTEALVRTCWNCGKKFIKEDGCNKMRCTCGAMMCYICRKPVKDYCHFNGEGGDAHHKCPLYSSNDDIHVTAVREEAKKAKKEMKAKNPKLKLKHDPTKILPKPEAPCLHGGPAGIHPAAIYGGPAGIQPAAVHGGRAAVHGGPAGVHPAAAVHGECQLRKPGWLEGPTERTLSVIERLRGLGDIQPAAVHGGPAGVQPAAVHGGPAAVHGGPAGIQPAALCGGPAGIQPAAVRGQGFHRLNRERPGIHMAVRMVTGEANMSFIDIHVPRHRTRLCEPNPNRIRNPCPVPRQRQGRCAGRGEVAHRRAGATPVVNKNRTAIAD